MYLQNASAPYRISYQILLTVRNLLLNMSIFSQCHIHSRELLEFEFDSTPNKCTYLVSRFFALCPYLLPLQTFLSYRARRFL
jgi:hypothetical protein